MRADEVPRAVAACREVAVAGGLRVDDAVVLNDSNRLAVHLRGDDVLARVTPLARRDAAELEVDVARRLVGTDAPVGLLDPRIEPRVHEVDGFAVTMWTYLAPVPPHEVAPDGYAEVLVRLHAALRDADLSGDGRLPHITDRIDAARRVVATPTEGSTIGRADRDLIAEALDTTWTSIAASGAPEQPLHGEPHPGNVIRAHDGLLLIDLETCCVGPVEHDIAHATTDDTRPPMDVAAHYPGADPALVRACWLLSLALATAWRCQPGDDLPDGPALARAWISVLRTELDL